MTECNLCKTPKFKKGLDKLQKVWYNRSMERAKKPTKKPLTLKGWFNYGKAGN